MRYGPWLALIVAGCSRPAAVAPVATPDPAAPPAGAMHVVDAYESLRYAESHRDDSKPNVPKAWVVYGRVKSITGSGDSWTVRIEDAVNPRYTIVCGLPRATGKGATGKLRVGGGVIVRGYGLQESNAGPFTLFMSAADITPS